MTPKEVVNEFVEKKDAIMRETRIIADCALFYNRVGRLLVWARVIGITLMLIFWLLWTRLKP